MMNVELEIPSIGQTEITGYRGSASVIYRAKRYRAEFGPIGLIALTKDGRDIRPEHLPRPVLTALSDAAVNYFPNKCA